MDRVGPNRSLPASTPPPFTFTHSSICLSPLRVLAEALTHRTSGRGRLVPPPTFNVQRRCEPINLHPSDRAIEAERVVAALPLGPRRRPRTSTANTKNSRNLKPNEAHETQPHGSRIHQNRKAFYPPLVPYDDQHEVFLRLLPGPHRDRRVPGAPAGAIFLSISRIRLDSTRDRRRRMAAVVHVGVLVIKGGHCGV